jgi:hypothetical protein
MKRSIKAACTATSVSTILLLGLFRYIGALPITKKERQEVTERIAGNARIEKECRGLESRLPERMDNGDGVLTTKEINDHLRKMGYTKALKDGFPVYFYVRNDISSVHVEDYVQVGDGKPVYGYDVEIPYKMAKTLDSLAAIRER